MPDTTYTISKHARERYAERIMEKDSAYDINKFIVDNEDKIVVDINKMIQYGTLIHCGKMYAKDGKQLNNNVEVTFRTITIEGLLSIQAGENPRVIGEKLKSFLSPTQRAAFEQEEGGGEADG